jgi:hypothetical protein
MARGDVDKEGAAVDSASPVTAGRGQDVHEGGQGAVEGEGGMERGQKCFKLGMGACEEDDIAEVAVDEDEDVRAEDIVACGGALDAEAEDGGSVPVKGVDAGEGAPAEFEGFG